MPLFTTKQVSDRGKLGIWHITELLEELLKMKRSFEGDLSVLNAFSNEHRKKEWLVARILVEELLNEKNVRITYDEHSKPFLENSKKHISISHSHALLAVILDEHETGIDIELIKSKVLGIKEKFMSDVELKSLQKENLEEQLTVYWCAKESLYKWYGKKELTFKENLVIEPFQYFKKGTIKGWVIKSPIKFFFNLQYEQIKCGEENYMLTYIINED